MSAEEPTTACWQLWHKETGNLVLDAENAAEMRDFLRHQLADPATTGWLLTDTALITWDAPGGYRTLADTPEAIRAWMEQT